MDERETIKDLYRQYWRCMIEKDAAGLERLMRDDYTLTHMTGVQQSKAEFLRALLDGTFNYYSARHECIEVAVDGEKATMTGRSRVLAAVYGGRKNSWNLQGEFTLQKEAGLWKLTGSKASTY